MRVYCGETPVAKIRTRQESRKHFSIFPPRLWNNYQMIGRIFVLFPRFLAKWFENVVHFLNFGTMTAVPLFLCFQV